MLSGLNPDSIEADLVITKSQSKLQQASRELLTTQEMLQRNIPLEKVRAVVARGNGVPDADCPEIPSLTRFWISTSIKEVETDEYRQEARLRLRVDPAASVDGVFANMPTSSSSAPMGADRMQHILQGLKPGGPLQNTLFMFVNGA